MQQHEEVRGAEDNDDLGDVHGSTMMVQNLFGQNAPTL